MATFSAPGPLGNYVLSCVCTDNARHFRQRPGLSERVPVSHAPVPPSHCALTRQTPDSHPARSLAPDHAALDLDVINAIYCNSAARWNMERGATPRAIERLPAGSSLYRIGSTKAHQKELPVQANYTSPWWFRRQELERILAKGQQDTSWAARVMAAIAKAWGSECDLQVSVTTACELYAWYGEPKAIDERGNSVDASDPGAYWIPDKDLMQFYIPGLPGTELWRHVFSEPCAIPWLWPGTQVNLVTGRPYTPARDKESTMPPGQRA